MQSFGIYLQTKKFQILPQKFPNRADMSLYIYTYKDLVSDNPEKADGLESVDHCARVCLEKPDCNGFVFFPYNGNCWLRKGHVQEYLGTNDQIISGICRPKMLEYENEI